MRKTYTFLIILGALLIGFGVGRARASQHKSDWLNPWAAECRCITNADWNLHDYKPSGDQYVSGSYVVLGYVSDAPIIYVSANIGEPLLRLPNRDAVREKLLKRLQGDVRPVPTMLSTKIDFEEFFNKHVEAVWSTESGDEYARFHNGALTFKWSEKQ